MPRSWVTMTPPSPAGSALPLITDIAATAPKVPTLRPRYSAPWACETSSITAMPRGSVMASTASMSAGWPQ